ncbi:hypothetical protein I6N95_15285 [Vagococcus sp. BWB3-3]|uniref:Uncharacterized protein n=1 Tax=Vagococcus allomyrinae TaxID=2794353 RepID=A0A940P6M4_9ENTE|nr:hypothetical protein [Vagococcus allomyrinae]MBP1042382.1 hypothetical protein [Vagococcus allomyrinae]
MDVRDNDIKFNTKRILKGFFANEHQLDKASVDPLSIRAASFISNYEEAGDVDFKNDLLEVIKIYRQGLDTYGPNILTFIIEQDKDITNENNLWQKKHDQISKLYDNSDPYDTFETALNLIGDMTEGMIKYHFRELYKIIYYLENGYKLETGKLKKIKLGVMNDYLLKKCNLNMSHLFRTELPVRYKISNWRNLAQHKNYVIDGLKAELRFETGRKYISHELSTDEMLRYYAEITRIANLLQLARELFIADFTGEITELSKIEMMKLKESIPAIKSELLIADFEITLSLMNLRLESYDESKELIVVYIDETEEESKYLSNYTYLPFILYKVWKIFRKSQVKVEYRDYKSEPYSLLKMNGMTCQKVENEGDLRLLYEEISIFTCEND